MDNDVIWPVLRNYACANPRKLKIDHSRPQSPSFLGHVVGKRGVGRLQIKPSGSGDENEDRSKHGG